MISSSLDKKQNLRFMLMRHAEPVTYGFNNSGLSRNGVLQILKTADKIFYGLEDNKNHTVKVLYSSRKRTKESGLRIDQELRKMKKQKKLTKVKILKPGSRKIFQTADSINEVLALGYPLEIALETWINLSPTNLKKKGIQTPDEIINSIMNFVRTKEIMLLTDLIAITHETTLMAFQAKFFPNFVKFPNYTEIMEINIKYGNIVLKYRNKEVKYYA